MTISFSDPIHGRIELPDVFRPVVESAVLARLRNIKQLGFTPTVYTGAVHTRFEHTLGTFAVTQKLLQIFDIAERDKQNAYLEGALLSEIGTHPLSYSTRTIFAKHIGLTKDDYRRLMYRTFLTRDIGMREEDGRLFGTRPINARCFDDHHATLNFIHASLVGIASNIDYVLRDSYYSGRHSDLFDFRYFLTLNGSGTSEYMRRVQDSLRDLYRSAHALNAIYGHRVRRFITLMLVRLVDRLVPKYMRLDDLKDPHAYVSLDDDKFLAMLANAVTIAFQNGDAISKHLMDAINQLVSFEVKSAPLTSALSDKSPAELESIVAKEYAAEPATVFCMSDHLDNQLGFVMFGVHFPSYEKAIKSKLFKAATGLASGGDQTTMYDKNHFYYVVLSSNGIG